MNLKGGFVGDGADMGMDFAFDESGGFSSQVVEEVFEDLFVALGFEHDGAVGLVADPAGDGVTRGNRGGACAESNALNSALEDDALAGDHGGYCRMFGAVVRSRTLGQWWWGTKGAFGRQHGGELGICWHRFILRLQFWAHESNSEKGEI